MNPIDSWKDNPIIKDNPVLFGHLENCFRIIEKRYPEISEKIKSRKITDQSEEENIRGHLPEIELLSYFIEKGFDVIYEPIIKNGELITSSCSGNGSKSEFVVKIGERLINFEIKTKSSSLIEKQMKLDDISQRLEPRINKMLKEKAYPFDVTIDYYISFLEPRNTLDKRIKKLAEAVERLCDEHGDKDDVNNLIKSSFPDEENCVAKILLSKTTKGQEGVFMGCGSLELIAIHLGSMESIIKKARGRQLCDNYPNVVVLDVSAEPFPSIVKLGVEHVLYGGSVISGRKIRKDDDGRSCLVPNRNGLFHPKNPHFSSRISAVMTMRRKLNRIDKNLRFERDIYENPKVDRSKRLYDDEIRILKS